MGFIGYFVKLIHIPMCVTRTLILTCSLITHSLSQKQHPCVRPVPNPMQYSCLPKPPAAAHDHPPSFHLYSLPLLYNAIAIPLQNRPLSSPPNHYSKNVSFDVGKYRRRFRTSHKQFHRPNRRLFRVPCRVRRRFLLPPPFAAVP